MRIGITLPHMGRLANPGNNKIKGEKAMSSFKGKVALVTRGISVIGRATAIAFAKEHGKKGTQSFLFEAICHRPEA